MRVDAGARAASAHAGASPVAAAYDFADALEEPRVVIVADLGRGTSDFTAVRRSRAGFAPEDVLAVGGVAAAGDSLDGALVRGVAATHFGAGARHKVPFGASETLAEKVRSPSLWSTGLKAGAKRPRSRGLGRARVDPSPAVQGFLGALHRHSCTQAARRARTADQPTWTGRGQAVSLAGSARPYRRGSSELDMLVEDGLGFTRLRRGRVGLLGATRVGYLDWVQDPAYLSLFTLVAGSLAAAALFAVVRTLIDPRIVHEVPSYGPAPAEPAEAAPPTS